MADKFDRGKPRMDLIHPKMFSNVVADAIYEVGRGVATWETVVANIIDYSPHTREEAYVHLASVLEFGAKKYGDYNWFDRENPLSNERLVSALFRHLFWYPQFEEKDKESGEYHYAHALCCVMFLMAFEEDGREPWRPYA